jgi:hypothetical protein
MDDAVWDVTVFTKNRDRLLKAEVSRKFFDLVVEEARDLDLMSDEHFTVDGTLLEACAGLRWRCSAGIAERLASTSSGREAELRAGGTSRSASMSA